MLIEKETLAVRLGAFYRSKLYWFSLIIISAVGIIFGIELEAATAIIFIMAGQFFIVRECARVFYPITFLSVLLMNLMGEDISRGAVLLIGAVPVFYGMFYNIKKYNKKFRYNSVFTSMIVVSLAITVGGAFSISAGEYFDIGNLYYLVFLGFGMVAVCAVFYVLLDGEDIEKIRYEFIHAVCDSGIFLGGVMIYYYVANLSEFTQTHQVVEMLADNPFRNVAVGYYLLAMPFAFFCARRKLRYMIGGVVIYIACLMSGSRMGLLFGSLHFLLCMLYFIVTNKRRRRIFAGVLGILLIGVFVMREEIVNFYFERTINGFVNPAEMRIRFMRRALEDFFAAPVFGRGIGYTGNRDIYVPGAFEMHWYHNFVCQIVGSLGLFGIIAYAYQFYCRLKLLLFRPTSFGWLVFLMYIGVLMSGITDTGIFTPFPTVFLLSCAFMLVGLANEERERLYPLPHRPSLSIKDTSDDVFSKAGAVIVSAIKNSKSSK
ncbi:MAG: O-antigen ligase family protein [Clostridia bacterium]|nr:O-antigen ligase family protein [Clostridia bacterium]